MEETRELLVDAFLTLINVFLVLVIVLNIIFIFFMPIRMGDYFTTRVTGNSMFPARRSGDLGIFKLEEAKNIKEGDVIIFREDPILIRHRVISIQKDPTLMFLTKGDNNPFPDGWVKEENIIAKDLFSIPIGFFVTPGGLICSILTLIVLILWKEVVFLKRDDDSYSPKFNLAIFSSLGIVIISALRIFKSF
jgi:signal peptidase I